MTRLDADGVAGTNHYYAVVRDGQGSLVSNCQHKHRTRKAAERCADKWLMPQFRSIYRPSVEIDR